MIQLLIGNKGTIFAISAICSLVFALIIYSLLRNARIQQARRWAVPFADTFVVLALLYLFKLVLNYYFPRPDDSPPAIATVFILLCSGVTNYLFILSAFRLAQFSIKQRWLRRIESWLFGRPYVKSPLLWLLCSLAILGVVEKGALIADDITSSLALILMGSALYRYRVATDKIMAWTAMISSIAYALLYLTRLPVEHLIQAALHVDALTAASIFDSFISLISLVLKFGFFFSAHSLMLWLPGPLQGFNQLFESGNREEKEYLESEGLVRSIREWLATNTVRLYVKLPGSKDDQIAVFHYPPANKDNGTQPKVMSYCEGTSYDHVMTSGATHREDHANNSHGLSRETSIIAAPVFFHNSVTACLEAEVNGKGSKKDARINLERLTKLEMTASIISPAVQTYREMSALNKLSQDLSKRQIEVVIYKLSEDLQRIAETIYDVVSPSWVTVCLEIGFSEYRAIYTHDNVIEELLVGFDDSNESEEDVLIANRRYRLLRTELEITASQRQNDQVFGKLVLGVEKGKTRTRHPAIGSNPTCRRGISDQVGDTLLDFVRGYLNQLTDRLGVRLSGLKATTVVDWHREVENTAIEAKLLWAVVGYSNGEDYLVGDDQNVQLVKCLEDPELWEGKGNANNSNGTELTEMWLHTLVQLENGANSIIKISLPESKATLWLGVGRAGFGSELNYVSPWKYFLHYFSQIADSALLRILITEERNQLMAELQNMVALTMNLGLIGHELRKLAAAIINYIESLDGLIVDKERAKDLVRELLEQRDDTQDLSRFLFDVSKLDKTRPSSIAEATKRARYLVRGRSLKLGRIQTEVDIPTGAEVDIPFHALSNSIAIIINNAKEAIREDGTIKITVRQEKEMYVCDISDTGPGVPEDVRKTLFKAPVKSDKSKGHGVGLYFSHYLLKLYGACLTLLPQETNQPTTFRIQFPK